MRELLDASISTAAPVLRFLPIYKFAGEDNNRINHLDDFASNFLPKCTLGQTVPLAD